MPWSDTLPAICFAKKTGKDAEGMKISRMAMTNINYIMDMTKAFLDGEIDCISYWLDFPYEIEKRYRKMVREYRL